LETVQMIGLDTRFGPNFLGPALLIPVLLLLAGGWIVLAASRFTQGGIVERPERVPQLYGYTVCLVALLWGLASTVSLIESGLTLSGPMTQPGSMFGWDGISVTSFEAFRVTYDRARNMGAYPPSQIKPDSIPEAELRRRYDAFRADRVERVRSEAIRSMVKSLISLVLAAAIFTWHWRWVRKRIEAAAA
jgi:hypothetical protein